MRNQPEPTNLRLWHLGQIIVTPSKISPWRETLHEGEKFTGHQLAYMAREGIDPDTVETVEVISRATSREFWVPTGRPLPNIVITCPVVGRTPKGRIKVVAPIGRVETVGADGRVLPPRFGYAT